MDTSFTGITNLSYIKLSNNDALYPLHVCKTLTRQGRLLENYDVEFDRIMFFANNKGQKTLSKLQEKFPDFKKNENFYFDTVTITEPRKYKGYNDDIRDMLEANEKPERLFFINGKQVEMNSENISIFSSLSKLFKFSGKNKTKIPTSKKYFDSFDFHDSVSKNICRYPSKTIEDARNLHCLHIFTEIKDTKTAIKAIGRDITSSMMDFFGT